MFQLVPQVATAGTHLLDVIELPPAFLIACFGPHDGGDRSISTGGWVFVSERGEVFTLYECRSTSAYQKGAPTPDLFWALQEPMELHIGGRRETDLAGFKQWLLRRYHEFPQEEQVKRYTAVDLRRDYVKQHLKDLTIEERLEGVSREAIEKYLHQLDTISLAAPQSTHNGKRTH